MTKSVLGSLIILLFTAGLLGYAQQSSFNFPGVQYPKGQDVSPTFDGWQKNPDGTLSMWFGYYNRNTEEEIDLPIGPDNTLDLGSGDQGQPTHFYPGRRWWVFKVIVPKDWPLDKRLVMDPHQQRQNERRQGLATTGMGSGRPADFSGRRIRSFPYGSGTANSRSDP